MKSGTLATLALVMIATAAFVQAQAAVPEYSPVIVKTYPHDPQAFTEGLLYVNGFLYESTGRNGQSSIRKVVLDSGKVVQHRDLDPKYFGEGIVDWKGKLVELTWKDEIGFVYDLGSLKQVADFQYPGEGWALTRNDSHLFMSDGSSDIRVLDPNTLAEKSRIHITCNGSPIRYINELEWVKGEIYANIWLTNMIVRINPATGNVVGVIDVSNLTAASDGNLNEKVPNGIAYDKASDRLFVTGKLWPKLYQITLRRRSGGDDPCQALPPP